MINVYRPVSGDAVVINRPAGYIPAWNKDPPGDGNIDIYINIPSGCERSPAVVIIGRTPADPCGAPFITRNPYPTVIVVKSPSTVMKRCPSPFVIRSPGITILGNDPLASGSVRLKPSFHRWNPGPSIIWIINPPSIRRKFIIKGLKRNIDTGLR